MVPNARVKVTYVVGPANAGGVRPHQFGYIDVEADSEFDAEQKARHAFTVANLVNGSDVQVIAVKLDQWLNGAEMKYGEDRPRDDLVGLVELTQKRGDAVLKKYDWFDAATRLVVMRLACQKDYPHRPLEARFKGWVTEGELAKINLEWREEFVGQRAVTPVFQSTSNMATEAIMAVEDQRFLASINKGGQNPPNTSSQRPSPPVGSRRRANRTVRADQQSRDQKLCDLEAVRVTINTCRAALSAAHHQFAATQREFPDYPLELVTGIKEDLDELETETLLLIDDVKKKG